MHQTVGPVSDWRTFFTSGTLGGIIFIHPLRSTMARSLTQSSRLSRY
nr:MAG TPA: hypothetical protein [Caudoviricetes sp.]